MKKTYISPNLDVVVLNAGPLMISASNTEIEVGGDEIDSKGFQGPAGGFLWEDDTNAGE